MGAYSRAKVVPFSSVVGSSIVLHDPETDRVVAQLGIMSVGGVSHEDRKQRSVAIADDVAKRVNSHDDLVHALDRLLNWPGKVGGERAEDIAFARAALAKARGGE